MHAVVYMFHHLQERGGSSLPAIKKYVAEHYSSLPGPWEKTLSYQIKKMTASGKNLEGLERPFGALACFFTRTSGLKSRD